MIYSQTLMKDLNKTEKNLINYLEKNHFEIINKSITEVAQLAFVSPSLITKTLKKVGFYGWKDYKGFIMNKITAAKSSNEYTKYLEKNLFPSIINTFSFIDEFVFSKLVGYIVEGRELVFIGEGFSYLICKDQHRRYNKIGIRATALNSQEDMINSIPDNSLAFFVTASGLTKSTLDAHSQVKEMKKKNVKTVLITANPGHKGKDFDEMLVGSFQDASSNNEREFPRFSRIILLLIFDRIFVAANDKLEKK